MAPAQIRRPSTICPSGGSVEYLLSNLPGGVTSEARYFTGVDATGTNTEIIFDLSSGGSQVETFTGSGGPSGAVDQYQVYSGPDGAGTNTETIYDLSSGGSVEYILANLPSGATSETAYFSGTDAKGTETRNPDRLQRRELDERAIHEPAGGGHQRNAVL